MPSRWTVCTTGYTAPWPCGERAASTASSRSNATYSSAISRRPCASTVRASAADAQTHTPLPSYPPLTAFSTTGQVPAANVLDLGQVPLTGANRGQSTPRPVSRSRMASLSWVKHSAAAPGLTWTPACSSAARCPPGTCSWSKVSTSHPAAKSRRSASER